jgi:hypothetical protein
MDTLYDAMVMAGFTAPPENPEPGKVTRFSTTDRPSDKAGWVFLFPDGAGAAFGDWRTGYEGSWQAKRDKALSRGDKFAFLSRLKQAKREAAAQRELEHQDAAARAKAIWEAEPDAPESHAYLIRKKIKPNGLKLCTQAEYQGWLVAAVHGPNGDIQSLQFIAHDGTKRFLSGGKMKGGHMWLGEPGNAATAILLAEGFATAESLYQATQLPVCVAFNAGNLADVAQMARSQHPRARLLVCGDDDTQTEGNPGRTKAAAAAKAVGGMAVFPPAGGDFNDLHVSQGLDAVKTSIIAALSQREPGQPPPFSAFTRQELDAARLNPTCIVDRYLYADLALVCAAGGTGKTTTLIYEAVCIALNRPVWGLEVRKAGATLFITAEDSRELFAARLREIMTAMDLTPAEWDLAMSRIGVWDVSGELVRLAELTQGGNIELTPLADAIVDTYQDAGLVQVVFDPAVSFGPGERIVNDGEQAIVTACRRIIRGLGCCVRIIHHTGKANARNGAMDQYASRGGTALPDGSRMVTVLSSVNDGGAAGHVPPDGWTLMPGDSGFILARAKLSYAPPQPLIWVKRQGHRFEHFTEIKRTKSQVLDAHAEKLFEFIERELAAGRKHTRNTLDSQADSIPLSRSQLRSALDRLEAAGRVYHEQLPEGERRGKRQAYLKPQPSIFGAEDWREPADGPFLDSSNPPVDSAD